MRELLDALADQLSDFRSEVSEEYVKTEDFEELLESTLRRVADERNADVRRLYVRFLHRSITEPGDEYDDQMQVLRLIEQLRRTHISVLQAFNREPTPDELEGFAGSPSQTLTRRTGLNEDEVDRAIEVLNDLRLVNLPHPRITMTPRGAAELKQALTDLGRRTAQYMEDG